MATAEELSEQTVDELRDLAGEAEVEGRSSMTKAELVAALADDTVPDVTDVGARVASGRTGLHPDLAEAKAQAREAAADQPRPSRPGDSRVEVVGREQFAKARAETRELEGQEPLDDDAELLDDEADDADEA